MHDAAPIILRASGNLRPIMGESICVAAVDTTEFLKGVEVFKLVSIDLDVAASIYIWQSIEGKTDSMIDLSPNVQCHQWYDKRPCKWYGKRALDK
jgi:hypothetical protein